ncbi:MAG: small subunit ribosomal protein S8 [Limisphaerales bacterium]|nr:MAG: small subunit ribosomal protein S8 [Limisphaerales bacterium]KAG0510245.1 MAG: small subunit ribosomal protein S8 [Limisphaerales bacterium]TXT51872.1 MAG: small subunit ribosomal protein S8 [Limisphaerales bacterium]
MSDPIADLLTRIRNAGNALLPSVEIPHSKMKESIAHILKREGYVSDVAVEGAVAKKKIKVKLKYAGRKSVIDGLQRVSSPGLRRYVGATEIPRVRNGMGTAILSTPAGILTGNEARRQNVGGELLCYVW